MTNVPRNGKPLGAQHGFLCIIVLILSILGFDEGIRFMGKACPPFATWANAHWSLFNAGNLLIAQGIWLTIAFLFTRAHFAVSVGANQPPTLVGWLTAWAGVILGLVAVLASSGGRIPPSHLATGFYKAGAASAWFFAIYATLLGPFTEEVMMRGVLYRAFRANLGIFPSTALILGVHAYFHFGLIAHAPLAWPILILLNIILCLLREKTPSLWNCILCHSVYNATQNMRWPVYTFGMLVVLPLCVFRIGRTPHFSISAIFAGTGSKKILFSSTRGGREVRRGHIGSHTV
jgi:membrane protease YdiL (CAAX protease family)